MRYRNLRTCISIAGFTRLPDGSQAPWKEVLQRTFADVEEGMNDLGAGYRILFLWDEVPFLLDNIAKRDSPAVAMEVLDVLRALGQDHDRIRLLLTGSIGLHHVLTGLKEGGYNGSPLDRMEHVQPGPLVPKDGIALANALLRGDGIECTDLESCAAELAAAVGHVPFYVHRLVSRLPKSGATTPRSIQDLLDREITADNNDWDLQHYRDRLRPYYADDETPALWVLDAVAVNEPLDFQAIRREVNVQGAVDDERLRRLLQLLCLDHYLTRTSDNQYRFYLPLIRRWWRRNRSL